MLIKSQMVFSQANNKRINLIEHLRQLFNNNFDNIDIDTLITNYGEDIGLSNRIDHFAIFNILIYSLSDNNLLLRKQLNNSNLSAAIKSKLPSDYFIKLLNSEHPNTHFLYLLLAKLTNDSAKINAYINDLLNEKTELDTKALLNCIQEYSQGFFTGQVKSFFLNRESLKFIDYTNDYIDIDVNDINSFQEKSNITAGKDVEFFICYKEKYSSITTQDSFVSAFRNAKSLLTKSIVIDIGLSKKMSFSTILTEVLDLKEINPKIQITVLDFEIRKNNNQETNKRFANIFDSIYNQYCNTYFIQAPKREYGFTKYDFYIAIVELICKDTTGTYEQYLKKIQNKEPYNFVLLKTLILNNRYVENDFLKKHLELLYKAGDLLILSKDKIEKDSIGNLIHQNRNEISKFFPNNDFFYYYQGYIPPKDKNLLFEKLITTQRYFNVIESIILSKNDLKDSLSKFPFETINRLVQSENPLNIMYGYYYLFFKAPKFLNKIFKSGNIAIKQKWAFFFAEKFHYNDKHNSLVNFFAKSLMPGFTKEICNNKFDNASVLHSGLEYFTGRESKKFYDILLREINDTNNCTKTNMFILEKYPNYFLNIKPLNNQVKNWYLKIFCTFINRKQWKAIFTYLSQDYLNQLSKCL